MSESAGRRSEENEFPRDVSVGHMAAARSLDDLMEAARWSPMK